MSKIGFWETFFDDSMSWREAAAINEAHDAINTARSISQITDHNQNKHIEKLFALDRAQAQQLERMAATIDVLTELLLESGAIDMAALRERIDARLVKVEEVKTEVEASAVKKGEPEIPPVQCTRCVKMVPAKNTQITASGPVCDRCYYQT